MFIVACQQKNGLKGIDREASALVPDRPEGQLAAVTGALTLQPYMHKGCTSDEQWTSTTRHKFVSIEVSEVVS